jgi:hypothetical protein
MASMNSATMGNLNRMTFLMSISEITPQIFISGLFYIKISSYLNFYSSGQMAATLEQVQKLGITYILVNIN